MRKTQTAVEEKLIFSLLHLHTGSWASRVNRYLHDIDADPELQWCDLQIRIVNIYNQIRIDSELVPGSGSGIIFPDSDPAKNERVYK